MPWRETGKVIGTVGDDNVRVQDATGRVLTMPANYFQSEQAAYQQGSQAMQSPTSFGGAPSYNPASGGTSAYWSFPTAGGGGINVTDPGRGIGGYGSALQQAEKYNLSSMSEPISAPPGYGYGYLDPYNYPHVSENFMSALASAGNPNQIGLYQGFYGGGYGRDEEGQRGMLGIPGEQQFGNLPYGALAGMARGGMRPFEDPYAKAALADLLSRILQARERERPWF